MPPARPRSTATVPIGAALVLATAACTASTEEPRTVGGRGGEVQASTAALDAAPAGTTAALHLVVAPSGNAARYSHVVRLRNAAAEATAEQGR